MSDQNVFVQTNEPTPATAPTDALITKLNEIKNEHGQPKYANVETAIDALKHSQTYIPELKTQLDSKEQELATLRMELAKTQGVQEALERFQAAPTGTQVTPAVEPQAQNLEEQVLAVLERKNAEQKAQQNFALVNKALNDAYGEKAFNVVSEKATSLGMTAESLQSMAKENPQLVLSLFNTNKPVSTPNTLGNTIQTQLAPAPQEAFNAKLKSNPHKGVTYKEGIDYMTKIREEVYRELGVQA